jgi:hypothetical protein
MAWPLTAAAQTTPPATPPTQQTTPRQPPAQPPAQPRTTSTQPADTQVDATAAKTHLSAARDTLSQLTSLPEAARLQGEARTQVSQVISGFNELITTQADWRAAYTKVDASLSALLGPETPDQPSAATGVAGAVGTSGTVPAAGAAGTAPLDPAVRAKLVEFRTHLKEFERAAGGNAAMAPSVATDATANPASPARAATPTNPGDAPSPMSAASAASSPTATMAPADQAKAAAQVGHADADKHLDAISAILNQSKTGTLTKAQTAAVKKHVAELRQVIQQSK